MNRKPLESLGIVNSPVECSHGFAADEVEGGLGSVAGHQNTVCVEPFI